MAVGGLVVAFAVVSRAHDAEEITDTLAGDAGLGPGASLT